MSTTSNPYGLKPINLIGGQAFNGGVIREIALTSNNSAAMYFGDLIKIAAGVPSSVSATPTTTTAGTIGVCVGVRYQLAGQQLGYPLYAQYLPANAVTSGYTNIFIRVMDDPDALFQVQASGSVTAANIGSNAQLTNFGGNATYGNSTIQLLQSSISNSNAKYAVRIVDLVNESSTFGGNFPSNPGDAYTDCIVKLNFGVHSYYSAQSN
jgi:hypothetical protein